MAVACVLPLILSSCFVTDDPLLAKSDEFPFVGHFRCAGSDITVKQNSDGIYLAGEIKLPTHFMKLKNDVFLVQMPDFGAYTYAFIRIIRARDRMEIFMPDTLHFADKIDILTRDSNVEIIAQPPRGPRPPHFKLEGQRENVLQFVISAYENGLTSVFSTCNL